MLLLSRNIGKKIMIGDNVVVTIVSVNGNQVKVGIDAPSTVAVHREEIYDRIQGEKEDGKSRS